MLNQFRKHYPEGSLVSELVTIDHGKYIVRVLLQNNSVILGTGLAADEKIEIAEDRAIERALNSLKLEHKTIELSEKMVPQPSPSLPEKSEPKPTVEVSSPTPEKTVEPVSEQPETKEIETEIKPLIKPTTQTPTKSSKKRVKPTSNSKKSSSVEPEIEEKPLPIPEIPQEPAIEEKPLPIPMAEIPQEPEIEEKSPLVEEEVLDFSEIIARSNAELKRLKWTTEQGREYLIKTYGKRSRQVLSDEELLEFLRYLESLPTPS
ncbi:MAG: hypothetical protein QNJ33_10245 [Crocosphaera sp.]|nr:hypothetical protein [Crocosphaera sp.]